MLEDVEEMGPIDYLCVEFPAGAVTAEPLTHLLDLVDRRIVRVLDMLFVRRELDGTVTAIDVEELERSGLGEFGGARSGLLGGDDLIEAAGVLEPGSSAVILVYENLWAAPLAVSLRRAGARLVSNGRIPVQALLAALDEADADPTAAVVTGRG